MKYCGVCNEPTKSNRGLVLGGIYYETVCPNCGSNNQRTPDSSAAQYHRQRDLEDHKADVLQPHAGGKPNLEFAREYPDMWENHYTEDEINYLKREL